MKTALLGSGALHFSFEKATPEGKLTLLVLVAVVAGILIYVFRKRDE